MYKEMYKEMIREDILEYLRKHKVKDIYEYFNNKIWNNRVSVWQKQNDLFPLFLQIENILRRRKWEVIELSEKEKKYFEGLNEKTKHQYGIEILQDFLDEIGLPEKVVDFDDFGQIVNEEYIIPVRLAGNKRINVSGIEFSQYFENMKKDMEEIKEIILIICYRVIKGKGEQK